MGFVFGIGAPELIFILILALLIFGPKRLPQLSRTLGKGMAEFRRASTELQRAIHTEIEEPPERRPAWSAPPESRRPAVAPAAAEPAAVAPAAAEAAEDEPAAAPEEPAAEPPPSTPPASWS